MTDILLLLCVNKQVHNELNVPNPTCLMKQSPFGLRQNKSQKQTMGVKSGITER